MGKANASTETKAPIGINFLMAGISKMLCSGYGNRELSRVASSRLLAVGLKSKGAIALRGSSVKN
jgi:hypothetical protein